MKFRWLVAMAMVGGGVISMSWGLFDVVQIGECGSEYNQPCPTGAIAPIAALALGMASAIIGAVFGRSGRLLVALFGLMLTTGAMAVYLSLFGPNAEVGADTADSFKVLPLGLGALGALLLLVSAKPKAPALASGSGGSSGWGGGDWGDSGGDSGCSSGCGGGCGGGGD